MRWVAGGGTAYTLDFSGPGNWIANNYLRNDNGSGGTTITVEGPGTMTWTANGYLGRDAINAVNINGGTLIIGGAGLLEGQITPPIIANLATLIVDAPSQTNNFQGTIGGTGLLQVNNGMLKLSGENVYTGNTILNGGEVVVNNTENAGGSGPLGVGGTISFAGGTLGFTVYDVFDYSPRFSTAAGQKYSIDTGGQSVLFTNGLTSSGGTLSKVGSGTLTLGGANTYSGNTTISSGKLVFQGSMTGAGSITVPDGTTLGVTGTNTQLTPGTLTLGTSAGATLEFNNVNSTATALIAAGTLSSAGTIIINVNSGTLTPGHSYPLLTWTSGPAPTVTLGVLNGFIGNLSFSGNKLLLNITATAYKWSGADNSSWDLTTANNWIQNGGPVIFANGGPALFDDTATGGTGVIISGVVQPTSVTVNTSTLSYTIFSSAGNDIGGSASLTKNGTSMLTLSGGGNTYTGVTTVSGGIVSVGTLANGGSASDLGAAANSAANL
ncbi:MAG: autotransporter-associated beta strand repeat-containing protein, partial [Tepidisphaeraceae bacterium]